MTTIVEYKMKEGETVSQALWSSGVWRKKDFRSFKDVAEGKPKMEVTVYDCAYLVNGCCANCNGSTKKHQPWCPGAPMKRIINITHDTCAVCKYSWVDSGMKICYACSEAAECCSCYTPDDCGHTNKHDEAYYAAKRLQWKANLAALGVATD